MPTPVLASQPPPIRLQHYSCEHRTGPDELRSRLIRRDQFLDPNNADAYFDLRELPHGIAAIGLEAGPLSNWLHKGLTDAGFETVLMETRQVKAALKAMPIKTDRRDAEGIARLLQMAGSGRCTARRCRPRRPVRC